VRLVADANVLLSALIGGRALGRRDPDDVDVLALALYLGVPVWSNDDEFREAGVEWLTTAALLKRLGVSSTRHD
jgi:predicted nucleic acid-binding protein